MNDKVRSNGNLSSLFSQNLCCDLPDSFFAFPAVRAQKILEAAPIAVQWIGSVGNLEARVLLICIQKWQIPFEAVVSWPHSSMGVSPPLCSEHIRLLVDECAILFEPSFELSCKLGFDAFWYWKSDRQKRLSGFCLRSEGQLSSHDLQLMELAYLHRQSLKNPWNACSAVQNDRHELESSWFDVCFECSICFLGLWLDPSPAKIDLEIGFPRSQQHLFSKMCRVEYGDDALRRQLNARPCLRAIKDIAYRLFAFPVAFGQILDGLPFPYMILPNILIWPLGSSFILKLSATFSTSVMLDSSSFTVLLYLWFSTVWTLFLRMVCSKLAFYPYRLTQNSQNRLLKLPLTPKIKHCFLVRRWIRFDCFHKHKKSATFLSTF